MDGGAGAGLARCGKQNILSAAGAKEKRLRADISVRRTTNGVP
jgi:hypothetical protein